MDDGFGKINSVVEALNRMIKYRYNLKVNLQMTRKKLERVREELREKKALM